MMKRLTIRNSDGSVSQPTDLNWAAALEKLAAYEDTELEPEEVRGIKIAYDEVQLPYEVVATGEDAARVIRWLEADDQGRLLVLPCKVGQEVYRLRPGYCDYRDKDMCIAYCDGWDYACPDYEAEMELVSGRFVVSDYPNIGKTVFLNREEAEAALEKESAV